EVVMSHFLLFEPGWGMRRIIDCHKAVVIGTGYVVDPGIARGDLVEWVIGAGRKLRVVGVNLPDLENASRGSAVPFFFSQPGLICSSEALAPGDAIFPK